MDRRRILAGMLGAVIVAPLADPARAGSCILPQGAAGTLSELFDHINIQRRANGRAALARDVRLDRAAQDHACWMGSDGMFGHAGAGGSTAMERARAAGFPACRVAENLAMGQRDAGQVTSDWMASRGHRENILDGRLTSVGLGLAPVGGKLGWVLLFATHCDAG